MCTVSIIEMPGGGYRLVSNRDEQRSRPAAEFPFRWGRHGIGPFDPGGGGTWIACRPGLTLCLLNYNLIAKPTSPPRAISRGRIIPLLIDREGLEQVREGLEHLELPRYAPFRLIVAWREAAVRVAEARWEGTRLEWIEHAACPLVFVSSGLGDALVADRVPLFEQTVAGAGSGGTCAAQDAFHRHRWPDRLHQSVLMARPDARTVSVTEVVDTDIGLEMRYRPVSENGQVAEPVLHEAR
ncbi:MAG: NRDE family protein [Phycisphaerales bacterium]|nr:NRDE family protein [Phycisphaerales bacterium]